MNSTHQTSSADFMAAQSPTARIATLVSIAGLVGIFAYLLIYHFHHERQDNEKHLGDFPTFYQAAEFARDHKDIYAAGKPKQKYVYPPLTAFLYVPLTYLPRLTAAHVSLVINAGIILLALYLAADTFVRRMDGRGKVLPIAVAFGVAILNENEMRLQLTMLETDAVMLLMFVLALRWLDRLPIGAGLALAFAFNIKYLPIVVVPYLLLHRRLEGRRRDGYGNRSSSLCSRLYCSDGMKTCNLPGRLFRRAVEMGACPRCRIYRRRSRHRRSAQFVDHKRPSLG